MNNYSLLISLILLQFVIVQIVSQVSTSWNVDTTRVTFTQSGTVASVTFDWWLHNDTTYGKKWGNDSLLTIDLNDPLLRAAAKGLNGPFLRLGGTPEDEIIYNIDGACAKVKSFYGCLTIERWTELNQFSIDVGFKLILGLNARFGRTSKDSHMDFSNIEALFKVTTASGFPSSNLWGFELGNELYDRVDYSVLAADYITLAALIEKYWPNEENRPKFLGPDYYHHSGINQFLESPAQPGKVMHGVTYHEYPNCLPTLGDYVLDPECLDGMKGAPDLINPVRAKYAPNAELWHGEGAEHSGGGIENVTDTFISSIYYADCLGLLGTLNVSVMLRQTLAGGDYGLLATQGFSPQPDYWIAWIWNKIVGNKVLATKQLEDHPGVRLYAHCGKEPNTVVIIALDISNHDDVDVTLQLTGAQRTSHMRDEYHITAQNGDFRARKVNLNGELLEMSGYNLPALNPKTVSSSSTLHLTKGSIAFVEYHTVTTACS